MRLAALSGLRVRRRLDQSATRARRIITCNPRATPSTAMPPMHYIAGMAVLGVALGLHVMMRRARVAD